VSGVHIWRRNPLCARRRNEENLLNSMRCAVGFFLPDLRIKCQCQLNTAKAELLQTSGKTEGRTHAQVPGKEEPRASLFKGTAGTHRESTHGSLAFLGGQALAVSNLTGTPVILNTQYLVWPSSPSSSQKMFVHPGVLTDGVPKIRVLLRGVRSASTPGEQPWFFVAYLHGHGCLSRNSTPSFQMRLFTHKALTCSAS